MVKKRGVQLLGVISFAVLCALLVGVPGRPQTVKHTVSLTWNTPATFASGDSYKLYRATASGAELTPPYATITAPAGSSIVPTSFVDSTVTDGTTYYYVVTHVRASDGAESVFSNEAVAVVPLDPTSPVTGLQAVVSK